MQQQAQQNRHNIFQRSISEIAQATSTSAENLDAADGGGVGGANNSKAALLRRRNNSGASVSGQNSHVLVFTSPLLSRPHFECIGA